MRKTEQQALGSGDRASLTEEKKEPTDDTGTDVYSQLLLSQHVSGIIMPIVRRTDCIKLCGVSLDALAAVVWSRDTS